MKRLCIRLKKILGMVALSAVMFTLSPLAPLPQAGAAAVPTAGQTAADPALEAAVKRILRENPELVLDVLRANSEVVLEAAQQGNILRKRKGMLAQWTQDAKTPKQIAVEDGFSRGSAQAPVTVVAFSDFTCGYCRQAEEAMPALLAKYKGKVRFVFKPLPKTDRELSYLAARYSVAAFAQGEEKGWAYYDALFAGVEGLVNQGEGFLKATGAKVGLDVKRLTADATNKKTEERLGSFRDEAGRLDVHGTPYFFVNNLVIRGAVSKELFEEAIEMALSLKK